MFITFFNLRSGPYYHKNLVILNRLLFMLGFSHWHLKYTKGGNKFNRYIWNLYILNYLTNFTYRKGLRLKYLNFITDSFTFPNQLSINNFRKSQLIKTSSDSTTKVFFKFNRRSFRKSSFDPSNTLLIGSTHETFFKKSLSYFQILLNITPTTPNHLFKVHHTYIKYGLFLQNKQLWPFNILKFYQVWKNFYKLIYNLFYFKINLFFLGSLFFKNETNALNFSLNGVLLNIFKYVNFTLFNINMRTNPVLKGMYRLLQDKGFHTALIFDIFNHQFTTQHLYNTGYYTISLTPISYFNPRVSFNIPLMSSNLINQLFFYRFILRIKQSTLNTKHGNLRSSWFKLKLI
uniref:Ribosomal protein S2 n=1 Tax=Strombidium cf. sulcatum TaxID=2793073 RepID=A0A7T0M4L5_9SPIT|nr:ribosomal protein S2 [Strombidium cf. sulcatum]QPL15930.1 ribosomal protein S2 [Strombidium cf. sulcatum]